MIAQFSINTLKEKEFIDITQRINDLICGISDGVVTIFIPHTTAGITINENADSNVQFDLLWKFNDLSPKHPEYRHSEGNSDAHLLSTLVGSSVQVIIKDGQLMLGVWQSIYFCEFDGPRNRKVFLQIIGDIND